MSYPEERNEVARKPTASERIAQLERRCDQLEKEHEAQAGQIAERTNRILELERELGMEREKSIR